MLQGDGLPVIGIDEFFQLCGHLVESVGQGGKFLRLLGRHSCGELALSCLVKGCNQTLNRAIDVFVEGLQDQHNNRQHRHKENQCANQQDIGNAADLAFGDQLHKGTIQRFAVGTHGKVANTFYGNSSLSVRLCVAGQQRLKLLALQLYTAGACDAGIRRIVIQQRVFSRKGVEGGEDLLNFSFIQPQGNENMPAFCGHTADGIIDGNKKTIVHSGQPKACFPEGGVYVLNIFIGHRVQGNGPLPD